MQSTFRQSIWSFLRNDMWLQGIATANNERHAVMELKSVLKRVLPLENDLLELEDNTRRYKNDMRENHVILPFFVDAYRQRLWSIIFSLATEYLDVSAIEKVEEGMNLSDKTTSRIPFSLTERLLVTQMNNGSSRTELLRGRHARNKSVSMSSATFCLVKIKKNTSRTSDGWSLYFSRS